MKHIDTITREHETRQNFTNNYVKGINLGAGVTGFSVALIDKNIYPVLGALGATLGSGIYYTIANYLENKRYKREVKGLGVDLSELYPYDRADNQSTFKED